MDEHELESSREARRQRFLDPNYYHAMVGFYLEDEKDLQQQLIDNSSYLDSVVRIHESIAYDIFELFSLRYTAGEPLDKLRQHFEDVVTAYERYAKYLREYQEDSTYSVFTFTHIDDYVRMLALVSLAYLLHRRDLIPRLAQLSDVYKGFDTLYEDLLAFELEGRYDVDEWYHELPYRYLINAMYHDEPEERIADMQSYLKNWYKYMKGCGWYDSHKNQGPEGGGYFGYWAWEAAAVAYLYDLDDTSFRDHLVYPKDLVAYARQHAPLDQEQHPAQYRVLPGEPCPKTGEWMVGHTPRTARRFTKGEMMPELNLDTGATIWMFVRD